MNRPVKHEALVKQKLALTGMKKYTFDRDSGDIKEEQVGICNPLPEQDSFAKDFCNMLNWQIAFDGVWRIVLCHTQKEFYDPLSKLFKRYVPQVIEAQWLDSDGDVHVVVEMDDDIWTVLNTGVTAWVSQCEQAYQQYKAFYKEIAIRPDQTFKKALGEKSVSGNPDAPSTPISG